MNEYWARELLKKDNLDYNKFYKKQIEQLLDVSRKDNKELQQKIDVAIRLYENEDYSSLADDMYKILKRKL